MTVEKTTRKGRTGKTRDLLPVFYLLSLILYLFAGCEQQAPENRNEVLPVYRIFANALQIEVL
jgi:hypothetical protein